MTNTYRVTIGKYGGWATDNVLSAHQLAIFAAANASSSSMPSVFGVQAQICQRHKASESDFDLELSQHTLVVLHTNYSHSLLYPKKKNVFKPQSK